MARLFPASTPKTLQRLERGRSSAPRWRGLVPGDLRASQPHPTCLEIPGLCLVSEVPWDGGVGVFGAWACVLVPRTPTFPEEGPGPPSPASR
jgi:hypothetical protein